LKDLDFGCTPYEAVESPRPQHIAQSSVAIISGHDHRRYTAGAAPKSTTRHDHRSLKRLLIGKGRTRFTRMGIDGRDGLETPLHIGMVG
jgi:hypothetical protein